MLIANFSKGELGELMGIVNNQVRCNRIHSISGLAILAGNLSYLLTIILSMLIRKLQPFHEGPIVLLIYNRNSIVNNKDIEMRALDLLYAME